MTVKFLKDQLAHIPDDYEILLFVEGEEIRPCSIEVDGEDECFKIRDI